jgi:DDE superfamily endonuclease
LFYLPAYSPDFNPDEGVWSHLKSQELKAHQATNKEELIKKQRACNSVFFIFFSLGSASFRYQSLRRVRVRSIPPNNSESSSLLTPGEVERPERTEIF